MPLDLVVVGDDLKYELKEVAKEKGLNYIHYSVQQYYGLPEDFAVVLGAAITALEVREGKRETIDIMHRRVKEPFFLFSHLGIRREQKHRFSQF